MELLKQRIFFKLKPPAGNEPADKKSDEYKSWRNNQKQPIGKWKTDDKFIFEELNSHPNIGMIIPQGFIVIDIDDKENAEKVNKALISKNIKCIKFMTGKGMHFLFQDPKDGDRNQSNGEISLIGIKIDSRVANKGYTAIRFKPDASVFGNGDGNRIYQMMDLEDVDDLPFWLEPIESQSAKKAKEVCANNWGEGSRDNDLLLWTNIIWNTDIDNKKQILELYEIINTFLMNKPLFRNKGDIKRKVDGWIEHISKKKENTVAKKGLKKGKHGIFGSEKDINYLGIAKEFCENKKNIHFSDGVFWVKRDKPWYEKATEEEILFMVMNSYKDPNAVLNKVIPEKLYQAFKYISSNRKIDFQGDKDCDYINFLNGRLHWKTGILYPYNEDVFITFGMEINWNNNTSPNIIDDVFNKWTEGHQDEIDVLFEFLGSIMIPKSSDTRGIILYGPEAGNGKTTLINLIKSLFKLEYITTMGFSQLESRFGGYDLIGKKLILNGEMEDKYIEKSTMFKEVVGSDDTITVEGKNLKNKITFTPSIKYMGATNNFPRFADQSNGVWRRLIILPFNFKPTEEEKSKFNPDMLETTEAKERLMFLAIEGIKRYKKKRGFTIPARSMELESRLRTESDSVRGFKEDEDLEENAIFKTGLKLTELYLRYKDWCYANNQKALGRNKFKNRVEDVFKHEGYTWVTNGKKGITLENLSFENKMLEQNEREQKKVIVDKQRTIDDLLGGKEW